MHLFKIALMHNVNSLNGKVMMNSLLLVINGNFLINIHYKELLSAQSIDHIQVNNEFIKYEYRKYSFI